jgi:hypothetical protein
MAQQESTHKRYRPVQMLHAATGSRALSVEGRSPLPCVRSVPGTDRVGETEGGHLVRRHDGPATLSSGCKKAGRLDSWRTSREGLLVPFHPVRGQRARHRQGGGAGGEPSSVAARRASIAKQRLQEGGAHRLVQDRQGLHTHTHSHRAWAAGEAPTGSGRRGGAIFCGGTTGQHR